MDAWLRKGAAKTPAASKKRKADENNNDDDGSPTTVAHIASPPEAPATKKAATKVAPSADGAPVEVAFLKPAPWAVRGLNGLFLINRIIDVIFITDMVVQFRRMPAQTQTQVHCRER